VTTEKQSPEIEILQNENIELKEMLRQQQERLDDILSSVNEVIWSRRVEDFSLASVNNACYKIFGYTAEEMLDNGGVLFDHIYPDDKPMLAEQIKRTIHKGYGELRYRIIHKNGSIKYIYSNATLKRDSTGRPVIFNGSSIDVSEYTIQIQKIQEQNEKLSEIARVLSHQVRGPVSNILGLAQIFNNEYYADPANKEILTGIISAATELDNIVRDIINKTGTLERK